MGVYDWFLIALSCLVDGLPAPSFQLLFSTFQPLLSSFQFPASAPGNWKVDMGSCELENWKLKSWKLRSGNLKLETPSWKLETGKYEMETGKQWWKLETGNSKLETGNWKMESMNWKLETGKQHASENARVSTALAVGFPKEVQNRATELSTRNPDQRKAKMQTHEAYMIQQSSCEPQGVEARRRCIAPSGNT